MMKKVNINIDRLVLDGFSYHDHRRISKALEQELSRLVIEKGAPSIAGTLDISSVDAGQFNIGSGQSPSSIGVQVARSIYGSLSRQGGQVGDAVRAGSNNSR